MNVVEATSVRQHAFQWKGPILKPFQTTPTTWDCSPYLDDPGGLRLAEEIVRRTRSFASALSINPDAVAISLPGTLDGHKTVVRSTRLGIRDRLNVTDVFARLKAPACFLFNDTESLAIGEARYAASEPGPTSADDTFVPSGGESDNFAYVMVDEGVGLSLFIGGMPYRGAGSAGHLGRLIVEPDGAYNRIFASRGPLEVFAARPWVSTNIVGEHLAEAGKNTVEVPTQESSFRLAVGAAAEKDWSKLGFGQIAEGLRIADPIAVNVLDDAARYLGLALNALITIANPPLIILGGGMIEEIPTFADRATSYARRFSWMTAWNRTTIRVAALGKRAQALGAAALTVDQTQHAGYRSS